jgi:ribonuclease BN (tRNA processing enzyme)
LAALRTIARGAQLLIFNSVVLDPPGSPAVLYTLHSPPLAIGQLAQASGVHGLLLSHLSPSVEEQSGAVLKSIRQSYAGPVTFAKDGMRVRP